MSRRVIVVDVYALRALTSGMIGILVDAGVEIVVPDFVADEAGEVPDGVEVVETPAGREQSKAWACWEMAGRPADLRPLPVTEAGRLLALGKLIRNPSAG